MKKYGVILLAILHLILYSCGSHCGFPDGYLKWIPYQMNDQIKYVNNHDTIILSVIDYFKTEPSSSRPFLLFADCDPANGYYHTTTSNQGYSIREEFEEGYNNMQVQISEKDKFTFNIWNKTSYSDSIKVKFSTDTTINMTVYQEVFLISKDTIGKSPQIAWIIKAKDKGIVVFYDYRTKQKWNLATD
jgi:hypothetical protein